MAAIKKFKPTTPARRYYTVADFSELSRVAPERSLLVKKTKTGGRNNWGRATNINRGGGHKRRYRQIDFRRDKRGVPGRVATVEYDPNRSARIALIHYVDGEKRYILAPDGIRVGTTIMSSPNAEIQVGNSLPLRSIPTGQVVHNVELKIGCGGQMVRSAGTSAQLVAKEGKYALLRMPSGEMRKVFLDCYATIGSVSNTLHEGISLGKAGRARWLNRRPHTRGVAKNPVDHPMGGGEGKAAGGRHPCTPAGVPTKGYKTRRNKRTSRFIVRRRTNRKK